jgi:hypothetical protein
MRLVRQFKRDFGECRHIELGDVLDTACLRSGARGTKDEAEPLEHDLRTGLDWVREMAPSDWLIGNHDRRPYDLMDYPSAIISELSKRLVEDMRKAAASVKCKMHEAYDIETSWVHIADISFAHGWMYNLQAVRDHMAIAKGRNIVIAHLHKPQHITGRVIGAPEGICVGTGADPRRMSYARRRRQTLTWAHGIAFGEYTDTKSTMHLISWRCGHGSKEDPRWLISSSS